MLRSSSIGVLALVFCVSACTQTGGARPGPSYIRTGAASFDPTVTRGPEIAGLKTERVGATAPWIVQFRGHVTVQERLALKHAGASIVAYQPDNALLVRATPAAAGRLHRLGGVRAVFAQSPALRIEPSLLTRAGGHLVPVTTMKRVDLLIEVPNESAQVAVAQDVRSMGGTLGQLSASGHYLDATLPEAAAAELAARSDVMWVQKANHFHVENNEARWVIQAGVGSANVGKTPVWDQGLTGTGQIIGIADSGIAGSMQGTTFVSSSCFFTGQANKILKYEVLGNAKAGDEIGHGTHTSCTLAGNTTDATNSVYNGQAKDAQLYFQDVGADASGSLSGIPTDLSTGLFPDPYNGGARIHSDSWGGQTSSYDANAQQVDEFVAAHPDFLVVFANGNAGPATGSVGSPATAKDLISVGATNNATTADPNAPNDMAVYGGTSFSSRGPTADGRIKPTLTAPGAMVTSADYQSPCGVKADAGTSMATPTLAGGATLAREYFTDGFYPSGSKNSADAIQPSAALLKAVLIAGADAMTGPSAGNIPDNDQGFGRVDIGHALYFKGDYAKDRLWIHDDTTGVNTGDAPTFTLTTDRAGPLKVALTWTDPAASAGANPALVNDLDLSVKSPGGTVYVGNAMSNGQSVSGGTADHTNVEEIVYVASAAAGSWVVTVKGNNVPSGPQLFAVAAVGEVTVPGQGAPSNDPPGPPPPPPPPSKCTDVTVSPKQPAVGWVDSTGSYGTTGASNAFGDDDIYSASSADPNGAFGDRYGVIQVPITLPSGKTIDHLSLTVTGQTTQFVLSGTTWSFDAVDMPALSTTTTYANVNAASVLATSPDTVSDTQVARKQENIVTFPAKAVASDGLLTIRIHGSGTQGSLMSWDSGYPTTSSSGDTTPGLGIPPVIGVCYTGSTPPPATLKLNTIGDKTVNEGSKLDFTASLASDPRTATPAYALTGKPAGATFDTGTGHFTWTPNYQQSGTYPMTITVTEGSASDSQQFTVTVNDVNRAPVFTPVSAQTVAVGKTLTFTVSATDPDGDAVQIVDTSAPSTSTFDGTTFSWTPVASDVGSHSVTFTASDPDGSKTTMIVGITVTQNGGDGGTPTGADGGVADGGTSDGGSGNNGDNSHYSPTGCACSTTGGSPVGLLPIALGLLGLAWVRRRRG